MLGAGAIVLIAARRAPEGYQDEDGFHLGEQREPALASADARNDPLTGAVQANREASDGEPKRRFRQRSEKPAFHQV